MKKLWAVHTIWRDGSHLGQDSIQLFGTRKEARIAKKNMKSLVSLVENVKLHRWCESKECSFISKKVYY